MRRWILLAVLLAGAGFAGWRYYVRPRTITVCVFTDGAFRRRADWQEVLKSRLEAVSAIYQQVGITWLPVDLTRTDPTSVMTDPDERRAELAHESGCPADLMLGITGQRRTDRTGSVTAFSHGALVVDDPTQPEPHNTLILAHELAHLFGATHDPGSDTLMSDKPVSRYFSPRTVRLIGHLRHYDFARGVDALDGSADRNAFQSIRESLEDLAPKPDLQAHVIIGAAAEADGNYTAAVRHYQEGLAVDPKNVQVRFDLAVALERNSQDDKALAILREGVKLNPDSARLHGALGAAVLRQDREEAIDEFMTSLRLEPKNAPLLATLGDVLSSGMGQIDAAAQAYHDALDLVPDLPQAKKGLARALAFKEKAQRDIDALRAAAAKAPDQSISFYNLALGEAHAGNTDAAIAALRRAIAIEPKLGIAHSTLALMYYLRGDYVEARNEVTAAQAAGTTPDTALINALARKTPRN